MKHMYMIFATLMISSSLNAMDRESRITLSGTKLIKISHWERNIYRTDLASLAFKKIRQGSNAPTMILMVFPFCFAMGYAYLLCNFDRLTTSKGERIGGVDLG